MLNQSEKIIINQAEKDLVKFEIQAVESSQRKAEV
jgi:hypothetical protein